MSSGSPSFLDKLKEVFSKLFKSKKNKTSSFKTPQELQKSRYGTTSSTAAAKPAEISQSPAPAVPKKSPEQSRAQSTIPAQTSQTLQHPAHRSIPRIQESDKSADVSPTEPRAFRTDRPHSEAVSALDQEEVADRLNKNSGFEGAREVERPISDIAATDSVHTTQSPTIAEKTEQLPETIIEQPKTISNVAAEPAQQTPSPSTTVADQVQQPPSTSTTLAEKVEQPPAEAVKAAEPVKEAEPEPEPEIPDRVDPLTAPEVVNEFDDEKVPVIAEPQISTPADTKFRMSATSGPLEDFPAGGEYYT